MGDLDDTQIPDFEWEAEEENNNNNCSAENNNNNCSAPWARLVALERSNPDIDIYESDTVVGRAHTNGNRKVSKFHCRIHKDSSGQVSVSNLSKNGTHVNRSPLDIEQCSNVQHGDEINLGPLATGLPQYIFHVLDKGLQDARAEKKRPNECLESDSQLENAKRLKLSKVKEDFKCCICLSVWHDVVSVAPCLHNFCNGCFSEWYKNKGMSRACCLCPQCRERVVFVKRNPTLSNIIEDYLQEFPSLRRPSEEIAHLDQRAIVRNNFVNVGGSDGHDVSTSDDDEDVERVRCPQCPRSHAFVQAGDAFCGPGTLHLTCTSCSGLMPERVDIDVSQKCAGCLRAFCGLYWHSQNVSPNIVLVNCTMKKMGEVTVSDFPHGAFRGNAYEQDVTKRYIQEQRLQLQDVILEWLGKMDIGETDKPELPCSPQTPFAELYFCNQCADTIVHHLLYKFRHSVPKSELPPDAAAREDCWYGRLCRTQLHRDSHARKFNHACEPGSRASHN